MSNLVECPACERQLRVPDTLIGQKVKCPKCGQLFTTTAATPEPPSKTPSAASSAPVLLQEQRSAPPARKPPRLQSQDDDDEAISVRRRGHFRLGECLSIASENWSDVWLPMAGYLVLLYFLSMVPFLAIPLQAGLVIVALAQLRGQHWEFKDFFGGFEHFLNLFLFMLVAAAAAIILHVVIVLPVVGIMVGAALTELPILIVPAALLIPVGVLALAYCMLRSTCFAVNLIVDRQLGPVEAMQESWALTSQQPWSIVFGLIVIGLIGGIGTFFCGVGIFLTLPLAVLAQAAAYQQLIGRSRRKRRQ